MIAYARARTKSLLSMLWQQADGRIKDSKNETLKSHKRTEIQLEQNDNFFNSLRQGGFWLS